MEEGGEGRGERGRIAKVTKDPQVRTLQQFVRAETEKSQATPAQKSQVTPDRSHKRPLYPVDASPPVSVFGESVKACQVQVSSTPVESGHVVSTQRCQGSGFESRSSKSCPIMHKPWN